MTLPRALLFDWDQTLADNLEIVHRAWNAALAAAGLPPITPAEARARMRLSPKVLFPTVFGADGARAARATFYKVVMAGNLECLRPMAGAEKLMSTVKGRGLAAGVVSNKSGAILRGEVAHMGWGGILTSVVGAGDAAADKPDPAPALMALDALGLAPGPDIWFVGDTDVDMTCACAAGLTPILVRAEPPDDSFAHTPHARWFADCNSLAALLEGTAGP